MKTIIADHSVWPKFEPWQPYKRDALGRPIVQPRNFTKKKPTNSKQFTGISYENQIKKLAEKLKVAT